MPTAPKPLFILHDASRTGAPMVLLHFLRWLSAQGVPFEILARQGGELLPDFAALAPTEVWYPEGPARRASPGRDRVRARARQGARAMGAEALLEAAAGRVRTRLLAPGPDFARGRDLAARYRQAGVNLIWANTAASGDVVQALSGLRVPVVAHVHELEWALKNQVPARGWRHLLSRADRFVAASRAVAGNLVRRHGVDPERLSVVHEFVPARALAAAAPDSRAARQSLGIPENALVVGGAGTLDWRKGADLFARLARTLGHTAAGRPLRFLWVGGDPSGSFARSLGADARRLILAGVQKDPLPYFDLMDVFCLASREDPFPLVCLEAAARGRPVVCFARSGGMPEFVRKDAGIVVPRGDVPAMAEAVNRLLRDPVLCRGLGENARARVLARHDTEIAAPRLLSILRG